jgi:hypothetical protein
MTTATLHRPTLLSPRQLPAKGPYARVPYCDEHPQRTPGCPKCRRWENWRLRVWRRRLENGERTTVPIDEVRDHIAKLTAAGMKKREIQAAARMSKGTYEAIAYKPGRKFVLPYVAQRLLDIPVPEANEQERPRQGNYTDATGSVRRIRALYRIGWTQKHITEAAGLRQSIHHVGENKWVTTETADGIKRAYDRLSMTPGPSRRAILRAERNGWPSPLGWDDDSIDDPAAQPGDVAEGDECDGYDPITVGLAVDGRLTYEQLNPHRPDLIEAVRRLAQRMTDIEIAHHLRWPGADKGPDGKSRGQEAVCKLRLRNGIPGPEKYEAVYAYGTRSRARTRQETRAA